MNARYIGEIWKRKTFFVWLWSHGHTKNGFPTKFNIMFINNATKIAIKNTKIFARVMHRCRTVHTVCVTCFRTHYNHTVKALPWHSGPSRCLGAWGSPSGWEPLPKHIFYNPLQYRWCVLVCWSWTLSLVANVMVM